MAIMKFAAFALVGHLALGMVAWADEMPSTTSDETGTTDMTMTDGSGMTSMDTDSQVGAADSLSPGNHKIAEALFESQTIPESGQQAWSVDQIAAAKQSGQGWGEIFHQLKAEGLIDAKNLGQVVSGHYQPPTTETGGTTVVITNAAGESSVVSTGGAHGHGPVDTVGGHGAGETTRTQHGNGFGHTAMGVTTAGGGGAGFHAAGHAYGHFGGGPGSMAGGAGATSAGGNVASSGITHGGGHGLALGHAK